MTEHPALCPACGQTAIREVINHLQTNSTVVEAVFLCDRGHNFIVRWIRTEPEQKEAS